MSSVAPVLDVEKHTYSLNGQPLVSVSRVIDTLMKKSWDGVDPEILRNAAERGQLVERYATEWLQTGGVVVPAGERNDVEERLYCFGRFYLKFKPRLIRFQERVWDAEDGVAGTLDFVLDIGGVDWLVDLKCTASFESTWALQAGAYCDLARHDGPCAVLHINPKFKNGYMWRVYDTAMVKRQWRAALEWYKVLQELAPTQVG